MENEKKIVYSQYFTKKDQQKILQKNKEFKYSYHICITYNNENQFNQVFKHIFNNNNNLYCFNWICGTKRKFDSKKPNRHKKKLHTHSIIFSNIPLSEEKILKTYKNLKNLDIKIIEIYDLDGLFKYLFDGHHIIKSYKTIKKIRRKVFKIKTIFKKLRLIDNDFIIQKNRVVMNT